MELYFLPAVE